MPDRPPPAHLLVFRRGSLHGHRARRITSSAGVRLMIEQAALAFALFFPVIFFSAFVFIHAHDQKEFRK
jgi:hypothetical protein